MLDFKARLEHEKQIVLGNITRQTDALHWSHGSESAVQQNHRMIEVQQRYLAMLDTLLEGSPSPQMTMATCEEALRLAELKHSRQIAQGTANSEAYWETLDTIEFIAGLIHRLKDWEQH